MMFLAGMKLRWITPIVVAGVAGILYLATHINERRDRLLAFLNPEEYQASGGYQQLQGLIAIGSGGLQGLGLGAGRQKDALPSLRPHRFYFSDDWGGTGSEIHAVDGLWLPPHFLSGTMWRRTRGTVSACFWDSAA